MNVNQLIEKYGKELLAELADVIYIKRGIITNGNAMLIARKYGIVPKSTKTVRLRYNYQTWNNTHNIEIKDGRNMNRFRLYVTHEDLQNALEE